MKRFVNVIYKALSYALLIAATVGFANCLITWLATDVEGDALLPIRIVISAGIVSLVVRVYKPYNFPFECFSRFRRKPR